MIPSSLTTLKAITRATQTNMYGLHEDSTKNKRKRKPKTERCGNKYPIATFNMKLQLEYDEIILIYIQNKQIG